jgi:hypothetical protein
LSSWWCRLLDGSHAWGSFDATVGRYGVRRYRLVIYPPGISMSDRRLLRLWRGWPVGGGMVALLAAMLVGDSTSSLLIVAAIYLGGAATLFAVTTDVRTRVRSQTLMLLSAELDPRERQRYAAWERRVDVLTRADHMLSTGAITPSQHELLWWQAYESLEGLARV